jgi:APA family basic amino acid/polyamine antiporter
MQSKRNQESMMDHQQQQFETQAHLRKIGVFDGISLVAGSMLGIGIFLAPVQMANEMNNPWLFLGLWLFTGIIALSGASAYAELGVLLPHSGGDYVFHRKALGTSVSFAYGWGLLSAGFAGSIAAMTVPLCTFQLSKLIGFDTQQILVKIGPLEISYAQIFAILLIWAFTYMHHHGLKLSSIFQSLTTYLPLVFLLGFALYAYYAPPITSDLAFQASSGKALSLSSMASAFLDAYFAYSGWNAIIYVAGEVKDPKRTLPYSLIGGTVIVTILYLLLCGAAIYSLGFDGLRNLSKTHQDMGSAMALALGGVGAEYLMLILISFALLASINATVLGGARVAFALALDGAFWHKAKELHTSKQTPTNALIAQAIISSVVVLTIPWEYIFSSVSLVMVVGAALSVISVYILRFKDQTPRAYHAMGYPFFPAIFVLAALFVVSIKIDAFFQGEAGSAYPIFALLFVILIYLIHRFIYASLPSKNR